MKRRGRIRPVSDKRLGEADKRAAVVAATHARAGWRCEGRGYLPGPCTAYGRRPDGGVWGLECNELAPRGRRPGGHLDLDNTCSLCTGHHRHVTLHRGPEMFPWVQSGYAAFTGRMALEDLPGWKDRP